MIDRAAVPAVQLLNKLIPPIISLPRRGQKLARCHPVFEEIQERAKPIFGEAMDEGYYMLT